jgi:hypothetical protein
MNRDQSGDPHEHQRPGIQRGVSTESVVIRPIKPSNGPSLFCSVMDIPFLGLKFTSLVRLTPTIMAAVAERIVTAIPAWTTRR